jgi:membrane protein implicated in regulation of membrane protease activity
MVRTTVNSLEFSPVSGFWFWVIVAIAFAVVEVMTLAFFAVFVTLGALAAALASLLGFGLLVQVIVLGVVGILGILAARPFLVQRLHIGQHRLRSGADSMIGVEAVLVDPIVGASRPGHVQIAGERWPAVTEDASAVPAETSVVVTAIRGSTLVVRLASTTPTPSV